MVLKKQLICILQFPFHIWTSKRKKIQLPIVFTYFKFHCLFNEIRILLDFNRLVFVPSVDHSCMMVLLLDAKKGEEKKKCILPECTEYDSAQTEQAKLHFVIKYAQLPFSRSFPSPIKWHSLTEKNKYVIVLQWQSQASLEIIVSHSHQLLQSTRVVGPQTKNWQKQPDCLSADDNLGVMMSKIPWPPLPCFVSLQEAKQISCAKVCLHALGNLLFYYKNSVRF